MLIGVKSTALKLGKKTKPYLAGFSAVMLSCLTATGIMCDHTWPYFAGVGLTGAHLVYQVCQGKYRVNIFFKFCKHDMQQLCFIKHENDAFISHTLSNPESINFYWSSWVNFF